MTSKTPILSTGIRWGASRQALYLAKPTGGMVADRFQLPRAPLSEGAFSDGCRLPRPHPDRIESNAAFNCLNQPPASKLKLACTLSFPLCSNEYNLNFIFNLCTFHLIPDIFR